MSIFTNTTPQGRNSTDGPIATPDRFTQKALRIIPPHGGSDSVGQASSSGTNSGRQSRGCVSGQCHWLSYLSSSQANGIQGKPRSTVDLQFSQTAPRLSEIVIGEILRFHGYWAASQCADRISGDFEFFFLFLISVKYRRDMQELGNRSC